VTLSNKADGIEVQLLEQEHRRIREGLAAVQEAVEYAHALSRSDAIDRVCRTLSWVRRDLLPHAAWEEAWLYPALDASAATPWATRALRFEHEQIRNLAAAVESEFTVAEARWSAEQGYRLAIALARLETLVSAHLAQEAWFIAPLLDRGPRDRAAQRDLKEVMA
jgi:hypothetical protein